MITNTIYASYVEMGNAGEPPLIDLWVDVWKRHGWNPVVLGLDEIQTDPRYGSMLAKAKSLPCLNSRSFELSNFTRWLAFSHVDGAVTDYDVFPTQTFNPRDFGGFVCGDASGGPGFIVGTRKDFSKIADDIISYVPQPDDLTWSKPHVSDMIILHRTKARFDAIINNILCYGLPGWKETPLVHFGNAYLKPLNKVPKVDQVKAALKEINVI